MERERGVVVPVLCSPMYLLSADLLVGWLAALCDVLDDLVPVVLQLHDGVLQFCCAAELLGCNTVFQCLFGFQNAHFDLCQLEGRREPKMGRKQNGRRRGQVMRSLTPEIGNFPTDGKNKGQRDRNNISCASELSYHTLFCHCLLERGREQTESG